MTENHNMQPELDIVVLGHVLTEIIRFTDRVVGPVLGGPAAYSSVAASRLGARVGTATVVGRDVPAFVLDTLVDAGVDVEGVRVKDCATRASILTYDASGNKEIVYTGIASPISPQDIPSRYLSARAFFICPIDFEVTLESVNRVCRAGAIVMCDLGGLGGAVSTRHPTEEDPETCARVREVVSRCHLAKASSEDCRYLFSAAIPPEDCARRLIDWGAEVAIITQGANGSLVYEGDRGREIPAFGAEAVDTTGAGDVYCAALLAEFLRTGRAGDAALYASAAASLLVERTGGCTVERSPTDEAVRQTLEMAMPSSRPVKAKEEEA
jgi:sugar/nucleoside kinase (ribokinase family)